MSHSQFHCTARVYLDMHGLSFETSICYWQDQPGSRHPRCTRGRPAHRRALPTLTAPALSPLRPAGVASRTRRWRHGSSGTGSGDREPGTWAGPAAPIPREASHNRPRRPALPAPPRARSRDRCAALFSRAASRSRLPRDGDTRGHAPAPRGTGRLGLTRPRSRPGCRSHAIGGTGGETVSPPCRGSTGRARGDSDPPRRA